MEKTRLFGVIESLTGDHLHIRGENLFAIIINFAKIGSPPHTWRKPKQKDISLVGLRITSTYVEKTWKFARVGAYLQDHLHIRGENKLVYQ